VRLKPKKRTLKRPLRNFLRTNRAINGRGYVPRNAESLVNEAEIKSRKMSKEEKGVLNYQLFALRFQLLRNVILQFPGSV
jgi:hypothetical protein